MRYIQWFITFPLLILELLLATGLSLSDIMTTLYMAIFVVVSALVGSLVHSDYKWGYFVFAVAALFYVWYVLLWHAPRTTFAAGETLRSGYLVSAGYFKGEREGSQLWTTLENKAAAAFIAARRDE